MITLNVRVFLLVYMNPGVALTVGWPDLLQRKSGYIITGRPGDTALSQCRGGNRGINVFNGNPSKTVSINAKPVWSVEISMKLSVDHIQPKGKKGTWEGAFWANQERARDTASSNGDAGHNKSRHDTSSRGIRYTSKERHGGGGRLPNGGDLPPPSISTIQIVRKRVE